MLGDVAQNIKTPTFKIMKIILKVLKYLLLAVFSLLVVGVIALQFYYNSLQDKKHAPASVAPTTTVPAAIAVADTAAQLLPYPQKLERKNGVCRLPSPLTFEAAPDVQAMVGDNLEKGLNLPAKPTLGGTLRCLKQAGLPKEGYLLNVSPGKVEAFYSHPQGLFYALKTLEQLRRANPGGLPCLEIEDFPAMPIRGVMLDISRDKVPSLKTLLQMVDQLSALKINHLQLYVEGFSFAYPSFRELWETTETPLTGDEIRQLDIYCRERFIELAPNQNSLGHMQAWLATERFQDLAECPDGYAAIPFLKMKTTLDPYDPRSLELVKQMTADLLPNFTSHIFNTNLDEPFELGEGKSKAAAKEKGVGRVYVDYVVKMNELVKQNGKQMWMWGDIVSKHPEILEKLPKDITLLEWGYEAEHPFGTRCERLQKWGLEFLVCPGTSSWTSLGGRTDNMMGNITNAVESGIRYGAKGMLLTDWGDLGHWQYLPVSYSGFAWGAALSWNPAHQEASLLQDYLNIHAFRDTTGRIGSFTLDLGRYNQFEEFPMPNTTLSMLTLQLGMMDKVLYDAIIGSMGKAVSRFLDEELSAILREKLVPRQPFRFDELMAYLDSLETRLGAARPAVPDAALIKAEFKNSLDMVRLGASLKHYISKRNSLSKDQRIAHLEKMQGLCNQVIAEHRRLWLSRNKKGGLERSLKALLSLEKQLQQAKATEEKGGLALGWQRFKDRTVAAGAAAYLRWGM